MDYRHPSGEVHIIGDNQWVSCPGKCLHFRKKAQEKLSSIGYIPFPTIGQDNPSKKCSVGDVPEIFDGEESHHGGPYDGVTMAMGC